MHSLLTTRGRNYGCSHLTDGEAETVHRKWLPTVALEWEVNPDSPTPEPKLPIPTRDAS